MENLNEYKLRKMLMEDLDPDEEILSISYNYEILMAVTRMFNDDIRYVYNYFYLKGELEKKSVMIDTSILSNAV